MWQQYITSKRCRTVQFIQHVHLVFFLKRRKRLATAVMPVHIHSMWTLCVQVCPNCMFLCIWRTLSGLAVVFVCCCVIHLCGYLLPDPVLRCMEHISAIQAGGTAVRYELLISRGSLISGNRDGVENRERVIFWAHGLTWFGRGFPSAACAVCISGCQEFVGVVIATEFKGDTRNSPLKVKINLNSVERPSPYRAVNTLRLGYKNQPVNAV
jgi:hypothetical protein